MATIHNIGSASALPLALIAQAIPRLSRHDLEALTERLIDYLDNQDGDPDSEDDDPDSSVEDGAFDPEEDRCLAGDDGCGPFAQHGVVHWGAEDSALRLPKPIYGSDQTKGPIGYQGGRHGA